MQRLIRRCATLGLSGGLVLSGLLAGAMRVQALTEDQVAERLRSIPVFTLTDSQGAPLVATPPSEGQNQNQNQNQNPVAGVFISRQDAQTFLTNLKEKNPEVGNAVRVVPVSLAEVYQMAQRGRNEQHPLTFAFIPEQQEVQAAETVLRDSGQTVERFEGVPLFLAKTGEQGSYLTIKQGNQEVIPMFFDREELQKMLDRLKQVQPDLANKVSVQVLNLEGLIQTLQSSNNQELNQIMLVPPQDSVDFVRSLQQQNQGQQNQGQNQRNQAPAQAAPNQSQPSQPQR